MRAPVGRTPLIARIGPSLAAGGMLLAWLATPGPSFASVQTAAATAAKTTASQPTAAKITTVKSMAARHATTAPAPTTPPPPASAAKSRPTAASRPTPKRTTPMATPRPPAPSTPTSSQATEGSITVEGVVAGVDRAESAATLHVTLSFGPTWDMTLSPAASPITWADGNPGTPENLLVGSIVRVRYTPQGGERLVKSLEILDAPAPTEAPPTDSAPLTPAGPEASDAPDTSPVSN